MSSSTCPTRAAAVAIVFAMTALAIAPSHAAESANVALGRPYTVDPKPNYSGGTSASGDTELTDGVVTQSGTMWTQRSAVGWTHVRPITITIDLGRTISVGRITWHAAAGAAGVDWPAGVYAYASVDGAQYAALGDIISQDAARSGPPPTGHYTDHTFIADISPTDARFVRLIADPRDPYLFVDEIQVFESPGSARQESTRTVADTAADFWRMHSGLKAAVAVRNDLARIQSRIATLNLPSEMKTQFNSQAVTSAGVAATEARTSPPARAALPIGTAHAGLFATLGAAEHAANEPALQAWPANAWSPLQPDETRHGSVPAHVDILAMRGERRSGALNIRNGTGADTTVSVEATVEGVSRDAIHLAPVGWTGTEQGGWIAAKILPIAASLRIPAGTTQQVWITFDATNAAPGLHMGVLRVLRPDAGAIEVPLALRVFSTQFPLDQSLLVGGWDYLQGPGPPGITASNADSVAQLLRSRAVNVAWATRQALAFGGFSTDGHMTTPPSTSAMDTWFTRWPAASRYRVFVSAKSDIGGISVDDPRFDLAVKDWLTFWAAAIKRAGRSAQQFDLHVVDEPRSDAQGKLAIAWSRAVKASATGFRIWVNPNWVDPRSIPAELIDLADVLCINMAIAESSGGAYWEWARQMAASGKAVETYGTDGPAKLLDPYAYYRAAAWRASDIGAAGASFWSFSDTGGGESSNEFAGRAIDYVPFFLDRDAVASAKHLEAIAEGAADYQYLRLLAVVAAKASDPGVREQAESLLEQSRAAVLASTAKFNGPWTAGRDRSVADAWRYRIGMFLDTVNSGDKK